ncbi:hypothetical protein D9M73_252470 [compost metagenome]
MVHQHRNGAQALLGLPDSAIDLIGHRHIRRQETGYAASRVNPRGDRFALAGWQIQDRDLRALPGKQFRNGQATTPCPTTDQRYFAYQSTHFWFSLLKSK